MKKTYAGVIVTFVLFALAFNAVFDTINQPAVELTENMAADVVVAESAPMMAAEGKSLELRESLDEGTLVDDVVIEEKNSIKAFFSGIFGILILSFMFTMLSWTVAEEVVKKRKVVLVNFKNAKGKKVMQALSNKTCQDILEELSKKKMTASELVEKIGLSAPRVHYNIKLLLAAELIEAKEFNYSEKGKEMDVYSLTRMHFMIGPEK